MEAYLKRMGLRVYKPSKRTCILVTPEGNATYAELRAGNKLKLKSTRTFDALLLTISDDPENFERLTGIIHNFINNEQIPQHMYTELFDKDGAADSFDWGYAVALLEEVDLIPTQKTAQEKLIRNLKKLEDISGTKPWTYQYGAADSYDLLAGSKQPMLKHVITRAEIVYNFRVTLTLDGIVTKSLIVYTNSALPGGEVVTETHLHIEQEGQDPLRLVNHSGYQLR